MSLTLNTSLEKVLLAKAHPIKVELQSTKSAEAYTDRYLALQFAGNNVIGEQFQIIVDGITLTIPVVATASGTGNDIPVRGAESLSAYRDIVLAELEKNYYICLYFKLSSFTGDHAESSIRFDPFDLDIDMSFSTNMTGASTSGVFETANPDYVENFSIALVVQHLDASGLVTDQFEHLLPVLDDNTVEFDIQKDFELSYERPTEDGLSNSATYYGEVTKPIQAFALKWAEYYGNPATYQGLADNDTTYYALHGGRNWQNRNAAWWTAFNTALKLHTYMPRTKTIRYDQPEFLYYFNEGATILGIEITYTRQDNTQATFTRSLSSVGANKFIWIKVGLDQLSIPSDPVNPTKSYTVKIVDIGAIPSTDVSETFTFNLTFDEVDYERFFLFGNSLGGCDVVRGTGKATSRAEFQYSESLQDAERDDQIGEVLVFDKRQKSTFQGSLGYKSKSYIEQLQELLLSTQVWEIDIENNKYIPLKVNTTTVDLFKDDDDLYKLRWEYEYAFENSALEF